MKKSITIVFITLIGIFSFFMFVSCSDEEALEKHEGSSEHTETEIAALDVESIEDENHHLAFDISMKDFIKSYNSIYRTDQGEDYLPPPHEWPFYNTISIQSDEEVLCYHFSKDESIRAIPEISVFIPAMGDDIRQIMISYDDHSYSIPTYEMYEEMCIYAIRTMLPDMKEDEAAELCSQVNTIADENISDVPYSSDSVPCALYYKKGVGIYPYYCIGEELRFCIIPVTEETLEEFEERGTAIIALQN